MVEKPLEMPKNKKLKKRKHKKKKSKPEITSQKSVEVVQEPRKETKEERMKRMALEEKRQQSKMKRLFMSSIDPYDKPLQWWEQPCVRYALTYTPVKNRLEKLMGSCVVRLTDRKFMAKLMAKIREDYETQQEARMQERKWRELMRTKTMILNRFISIEEADAEILEYPLFQLFKYCDSLERRTKKPVPKKIRISSSLYDILYPVEFTGDGSEEEESGDLPPSKEVVIDGEVKLVPLSGKGLEEFKEKKELENDIQDGYRLTQEEFDSLHYEADTVKKLKVSKTVEEMYKKAHTIVGALHNWDPNEKRRRCGFDDIHLSSSTLTVSAADDDDAVSVPKDRDREVQIDSAKHSIGSVEDEGSFQNRSDAAMSKQTGEAGEDKAEESVAGEKTEEKAEESNAGEKPPEN